MPNSRPLPSHPAPRATGALDLVIFDCDGVLINSEEIAAATMAAAMQAEGIAITPHEAHLRFTGNAASESLRILEEEFGLRNAAALAAHWDRELYARFRRELAPMAGIEAAIEFVTAELGSPVCVASNSTVERLQNSLGLLPLWERFAPHVFSAQMVARPKPAPDLVRHALAQMGARAGRTVMIDDSAHGVEAARAAGALAIGFADPQDPRPGRVEALHAAGADWVARGAGELPALLVVAAAHVGSGDGEAAPEAALHR